MSAPIFISYRRDETAAEAQWITKELKTRYGEGAAFIDVTDIPDGAKWPEHLRAAIEVASTILVVIGRRWLSKPDGRRRRRIDQPDDWVRKEVEYALASADKTVIPVLVDGASMPERDNLPEAIVELCDRQSRTLRRDSFAPDLDTLMAHLARDFEHQGAKMRIPVRIFFAHAPSCGPSVRRLLLGQNAKQGIFEFDLADQLVRDDDGATFDPLRKLRLDSKLEFVEAFTEAMNLYNSRSGRTTDRINIAITELPFPDNFYTWFTGDRRGIVIGVASLKNLFREKPALVDKIILRVVQRMALFALWIDDLATHPETRACLFDFTEYLEETQYLADEPSLCDDCRQRIEQGRDAVFLTSVEEWLETSSFGGD